MYIRIITVYHRWGDEVTQSGRSRGLLIKTLAVWWTMNRVSVVTSQPCIWIKSSRWWRCPLSQPVNLRWCRVFLGNGVAKEKVMEIMEINCLLNMLHGKELCSITFIRPALLVLFWFSSVEELQTSETVVLTRGGQSTDKWLVFNQGRAE